MMTCAQCGLTVPLAPDGLCPACRGEPIAPLSVAGSTVTPSLEAIAPPAEVAPPVDRLAEFRQTLLTLTPRVHVTPTLIVLNVLVFILMVVTGVSPLQPKIQDLLRWGADFGPLTVHGEWWRLGSSTFVHVGIIHLLLNMWVLAIAGPLVERMVGNLGFLVMYLTAGLLGSVASLFWNPMLVSAGASGAIFGIYGALLGLLLRSHGSIPTQALAQLRSSGVGFLAYNLLFGFLQPNIDSAAHIGGLVGGFLCGVVLSQPFTPAALVGRRWRNVAIGGLGVLLVVFGAVGVQFRHPNLPDAMGAQVRHGNLEIYYTPRVTKEEADRLGSYLLQTWGNLPGNASMQLEKTPQGYQVRMVVRKEFQQNEAALQQLQFDGARISRDVFNGSPVAMHACDEHLQTFKVLPPRPDLRHGLVEGKVELFFSAEVTRADAERLVKYLARELKDEPSLRTFKLARRGAVFEVHMVVNPAMIKDQATITGLRQARKELGDEVFKGTPVELHLCDESLNVLQVLKP